MKRILAFTLILAMVFSLMPVSTVLADDTVADNEMTVAQGGVYYSYADIVDMVTDMELLAQLPPVGESGAAATSYDRTSRYDEKTDTYIKWADYEVSNFNGSLPWTSNADGLGYIEDVNDERSEGMLATDIKGAGAIFRSWFATVGGGDIDIYIDGATEPTISMPTKGFVDSTVKNSSFYGLNNLAYTIAEGKNNYTPITFNESCRIILRGGHHVIGSDDNEDGWGQYFHFSYRLFPEGVTVEPIGSTFTPEQKAALLACNEKLGNCGQAPDTYENETTATADCEIPVGERVTVFKTEGEGTITQFKVKFNTTLSAIEQEIAMQKLELSMYWDGEESPSVWSPFGDFFATPGGKIYRSLPLGLDDDGTFYSYWYMPYANRAEIVLENLGDMDYDVHVEVSTAPLKRDIDSYARFHTKWSLNLFQPEREDRVSDYTVLKVTGAGRWLGFNLHLYMITGGYWWGEGDEKFFVDGEKFPSTFGTGSEDYFGYAWGWGDYFAQAFHAQNWITGFSSEKTNINNVRFQIGDNVPFKTEFEASIEKFFDNDTIQYATTAFFYLSADGDDPYPPVKYEEGEAADYRYMALNHIAEEAQMRENCNSIEGEHMAVVSMKGTGLYGNKDMTQYEASFSGEKQLWLYNSSLGDEMLIEFPLDEDYEGPLYGSFCTADDYGIVQLYLNGEKLGEPIDFYSRGVAFLDMYKLGDVSLKAGSQQLKVEIVGTNDPGWHGYLFGIDRLVLGAHPVSRKQGSVENGDTTESFEYWLARIATSCLRTNTRLPRLRHPRALSRRLNPARKVPTTARCFTVTTLKTTLAPKTTRPPGGTRHIGLLP